MALRRWWIPRGLHGRIGHGPACGSRGRSCMNCMWGPSRRRAPGRPPSVTCPRLADLGVTVLEIMPVAEFPGLRGWGYDGVDLFAPSHLYGRPDDFKSFVNRAHELGLGVILDVVYNHVGPDGNFLKRFSERYFSKKHMTDWGEGINYESDDVREFFLSNAEYWISEFHPDSTPPRIFMMIPPSTFWLP